MEIFLPVMGIIFYVAFEVSLFLALGEGFYNALSFEEGPTKMIATIVITLFLFIVHIFISIIARHAFSYLRALALQKREQKKRNKEFEELKREAHNIRYYN